MPLHTLYPETANTKINFIKSHLDQTHIIADFDGTLTKYFDEFGKARESIISLLRHENILDEEYSQLTKAMYAKYSIIEHDDTLPLSQRQDAMVEWRTTHKELLMKK
jgi:Pyrimidine 5'-nucleotidase (UMPH-1)